MQDPEQTNMFRQYIPFCTYVVLYREPWGEDMYHVTSATAAPSLYETVRHGNTAAVVESLQAQLKMREGQ